MRIGLTGSTGVLGQVLMAHWIGPQFIPFKGDITKIGALKDWYVSSGPLDGLLHLAALVPVEQVKADPLRAFEVNVAGTCHLLETVRKSEAGKRPWIFYSSSSHVYETSVTPIRESSPINPVTLYGQTKEQGDKWCEIYREQYDLQVCIGRIFSNSSPKQPKSYFLPSMIQKITQAPHGGELEVRGLHGTRDFLTTHQIVEAIRFLFEKKLSGTFNIGTGTQVKLFDLVVALQKKLGREDIKIRALESETNHLVANVDKLKNAGLKLNFEMDSFLDYILDKSLKLR